MPREPMIALALRGTLKSERFEREWQSVGSRQCWESWQEW